MSRRDYATLYGPTTGDAVRLGDTSLLAEIEHDYAVPGDECLHGGGKTLRDGMGLVAGAHQRRTARSTCWSATSWCIDPVLGIVKGDIGIKDGRIVGGRQGRQPGDHGRRRSAPDRAARPPRCATARG